MTPLMTNTADSQTRRAPSASATNEGSPGVSIRLTLTSRHMKEASDAEIDIPRAFSSSSASDTVVPSATVPRRVSAPASNKSASWSEVLPLPRWPTSATLRILLAAWGMPAGPPSSCPLSLAAGLCRRTVACGLGKVGLLAQVVALEAALQPENGLGVELRDARLGHAEDLADLAQRQVLVVVERDHELLALGQRRDRVGEPVLELGRVQQLLRVGRVGIVQRVEQRDLVAGGVRDRPQLVERDHGRVRDLDERLLELLDREVELQRHLLVRGSAVQAQLVDDRALDARDRVGLELDLAVDVEALDRVDQADQPVRDQVGFLDMGRQAGGHPAGDVLDQRGVGDHELLACAIGR